jgi:hypothetical protein
MLKKNLWVAGLMVVLAIMFVGCVDPVAEEEGGETVTIFDLQEVIKDLPAGVIASDADWGAIFKGTPFMMCGGTANGEYSIIDVNGYKKVKVDKMGPNWGVGFDLYNADTADGTTGAAFRSGDEIHIEGTADTGSQLILNGNASGEKRLGDVSYDGDFEGTYKLTTADIGTIRAASPQAVRIHYRGGSANGRKGPIVIAELTIKGKRGGVQDTFGDDFTVTDRQQVAQWVAGLTITPKKGKSEGKITQYFESREKVQKLNDSDQPLYLDPDTGDETTDADNGLTGDDKVDYEKVMIPKYPLYFTGTHNSTIPQALGVYYVTFDVAAVKDKFNAATGLDAGSLSVLASVPAPFAETGSDLKLKHNNGGAWTNSPSTTADPTVLGPDSENWVFLYHTGIGDTSSSALFTNAMPLVLRTYVGSNQVTRYMVKFADNWRDFAKVTVTMDIIGTSFGCSNGHAGKDCFTVRRNQGDNAWANGDISYPEETVGSGINTVKWTFDVGTELDPSNVNSSGIQICRNHGGASIVKVTKVEYHY